MTRHAASDDGRAPGDRGREAEEIAATWLERHGFTLLARNHSMRRGEVDLICREGATLCFVEVRSRRAGAAASPAESVNRAKMRRVVAAATDWALRHGGLDQPMRFDFVSVTTGSTPPTIELIRGAFDAAGEAPF